MLTVDIEVNGRIISTMRISQTRQFALDRRGYSWRIMEMPHDLKAGRVISGYLEHNRDDGALVLIKSVLESIIEHDRIFDMTFEERKADAS